MRELFFFGADDGGNVVEGLQNAGKVSVSVYLVGLDCDD